MRETCELSQFPLPLLPLCTPKLTHRVLTHAHRSHIRAVRHGEWLRHARIRGGAHLEQILQVEEQTKRIEYGGKREGGRGR